jgi:hypothetical protein
VGHPTERGLAVAARRDGTIADADGTAAEPTEDGRPPADITIGREGGTFAYACVAGWEDWHVDLPWGAGTTPPIDVTIVWGCPFVVARCAERSVQLRFRVPPTVWADRGAVLGVTVDGAHYGVFAPEGTTWSDDGDGTLTIDLRGEREADSLVVAVLPDFAQSTLEAFERRVTAAGSPFQHLQRRSDR